MNKCGYRGCKFQTNQAGRLQNHLQVQHGGVNAQSTKKEFRGHLANVPKKNK